MTAYGSRGSRAFQKWLSETDNAKLECRVLMHHWPNFMSDRTRVEKQRDGSYVISALCIRGCGVQRTQYVESDGILDTARSVYNYTDARGYLYSEDDWSMDARSRGLIRLELMTRKRQGEKS